MRTKRSKVKSPTQRTSDMCSEVIAPGARRVLTHSPQPPVNNFAATKLASGDKHDSGRIAPRRRRSRVAYLTKVQLRTSPGVAARSQTSERTTPCEGPDISTTRDRPTMRRKEKPMNTTFAQHTHYAGLDWAKDHHQVVILDRAGTIVADFAFTHDAAGWALWRQS